MEISKALSRHREFVLSIASGEISDASVDSRISASWRRCIQDYGLDPKDPPETVDVGADVLQEHQERLGSLLSIARVEMTNLYQQIAGSGHSIMLTDNSGLVLNYVGDPAFGATAAAAGLREGAQWTESLQGTNGMGTCLADGAPVVVHQNEHFFGSNLLLTCTAAPIMDADERVIAVLDASSESARAQQHTMALVNMSAKMIENRVFLSSFRKHFILHFHSRAEFINTLGEGLIAFRGDGSVLAANRSALFQLDYKGLAEVRARSIEELFDNASTLLKHSLRPLLKAVPIYETRHAHRFFGIVQVPDTRQVFGLSAAPSARDPGSVASKGHEALNALEFGDTQMRRNIRVAQRVLDREIPILVTGESGTGKGVFAKALHLASERADKPFVAINCASIPEALIESELFGYKPGAFTGASRRGNAGKIVQADGGTLFLDEIGDMPLSLQARLLRVLEEKEVVPLGGHEPVSVDLRVISATHRDLRAMVTEGEFREDLFYRLQGIKICLPALRERADKRELIRRLIALENIDRQPPVEADEAVVDQLASHDWPGNIRQLRNVLKTLLALSESGHLVHSSLIGELLWDVRDTAQAGVQQESLGDDRESSDPLRNAEREALLQELERHHWNVSSTARRLKLSRNTLYRKMKRCRIALPK